MLIEERGNTIVESMAGTGIVVPICELYSDSADLDGGRMRSAIPVSSLMVR